MTLKERLQSLINAANTTTGKSDADMTAATQSLIDGFGGGGDTALEDALVLHNLTEYRNDRITALPSYTFANWTVPVSLTFGSVTDTSARYLFMNCNNIKKVDFKKPVNEFGVFALYGISILEALILRGDNVSVLASNAVGGNSSILNGTGYIYVPKALVEQYKAATNWVTYASQIRAIEDYPDITGG